jgi:cis-L-3-hydroxyproline dehydratase
MQLSEYEKRMLDGGEGRLKQIAMDNIVRYANVLGAKELCEVTKATVFCGSHNYLSVCKSDDIHEVFSKMNLAVDETVIFDQTHENCYVQSCVAPCDQYEFQPFGQSEAFFNKNNAFLEQAKKAGVNIAGTCSPYLTGWLPIKGEHFVTTESGVTVTANSLWGAMGNSDGIEAAFWSSICGRTPKWGNHIDENRAGTHLIEVTVPVDSLLEWNLLGKAVGSKMPSGGIPVIKGDFSNVDFNKLRSFFTMLAISSNCEMCHIVGITPEANTIEDAFKRNKQPEAQIIDKSCLEVAYESVCDRGESDVDFVSLGCPHFDINQIKQVATYLKGKKIHPNVHFMLWTVYPIKCMADENGYTKIVEDAGGFIYTSTCPGSIGDVFLKKYKSFVFDSLKKSGSIKSETDGNVYFGDIYRCIDSAIKGKWEECDRWK